ncbi:NAD(P)H-binding protein [Mycobacterium sp. 21AC1]|uniref:NAD(P)H-binding protein n=1 Tax=[Mycobacterium] appelbergii TaxID=2939269 RepID=UPI002938DA04|nr:NAD(P)H-binding protein [Mycobacterium sp. 21AC1]MDV3126030.1 NAD(P)H-binding protein [Mycobacterium sp. 21AC1]
MSVGITGASGALGRLVADSLLNVLDPADVVLTTRNPDALSEFTRRGARVRHADFGDPATLLDAFTGVDRLLVISADNVGSRVAGHLAAIDAAKRAGVSHVVYTSVPQPAPENPALVVADHRATEDALHASGLQWTALRNNVYADMQLPVVARAAATGRLVTNAGDGGAAYVTRADCAAAAVGVLTGTFETNVSYDITGPHAVTAHDLGALAGDHVEVIHVDDDAYAAGLRDSGLPADVADLLTSFGAAVRGGFLADVTDAVPALSGTPATSLTELIAGQRS